MLSPRPLMKKVADISSLVSFAWEFAPFSHVFLLILRTKASMGPQGRGGGFPFSASVAMPKMTKTRFFAFLFLARTSFEVLLESVFGSLGAKERESGVKLSSGPSGRGDKK